MTQLIGGRGDDPANKFKNVFIPSCIYTISSQLPCPKTFQNPKTTTSKMHASQILPFGVFAIASIFTLVDGQPLSVTEFQQALAPVSDAINALNLAIETNQSATAIVLQSSSPSI
jgi:hypothetical protein